MIVKNERTGETFKARKRSDIKLRRAPTIIEWLGLIAPWAMAGLLVGLVMFIFASLAFGQDLRRPTGRLVSIQPSMVITSCPENAALTPLWTPALEGYAWQIPGCEVEGRLVTPRIIKVACPESTTIQWWWDTDRGKWGASCPGRGPGDPVAYDLSEWWKALRYRPSAVYWIKVECVRE